MSAPNNLEGPPPTPEERAAMARELDAVAPTPGDKFRLMFNRPTPRTDASRVFVNMTPDPNATPAEFVDAATCETLERELAAAHEEGEEQARLLGMSGEREAGLLAEIDRLKRERNQARGLLKYANKGAERNAEALRISSEKLNEARGQRDRLADALRACMPIIGKPGCPAQWKWASDDVLDKAWKDGQAALAALKGGTDE